MGIFKAIIGLYLPSMWMVTNQQHTRFGEEEHFGILFRQYFVWHEDANKEYTGWIGLKGYDTAIWKRYKGAWYMTKKYNCVLDVTTRYHAV